MLRTNSHSETFIQIQAATGSKRSIEGGFNENSLSQRKGVIRITNLIRITVWPFSLSLIIFLHVHLKRKTTIEHVCKSTQRFKK